MASCVVGVLFLSFSLLVLAFFVGFVKFDVRGTEEKSFDEIVNAAKVDLTREIYYNHSTPLEILGALATFHQTVVDELVFTPYNETDVDVSDSLEYIYNVFSTLGDPRVDESKVWLTLLVGGAGMLLYFFNVGLLSGLFATLKNGAFGHATEEKTLTQDDINRLLLNYRRKHFKRQTRLQVQDTIFRQSIEPEQKYLDFDDPYTSCRLASVNPARARAAFGFYQLRIHGICLLAFLLVPPIVLAVVYIPIYNIKAFSEMLTAAALSIMTVSSPTGPGEKWYQNLVIIPLTFIAQCCFFVVFWRLTSDVFIFLEKKYPPKSVR